MTFLAACVAFAGLATGAAAQTLPSEPITFGGGRVVIGGDVAASVAPEDTGFFNYSDYEHSTLRELRLSVKGSVQASKRLSFLAEIRSENFDRLSPFALYARVRPLPGRRLDIQVGRIPPTFGAFTRRAYGRDNPLIGYPLAYQYLTSLRADAVPASAEELVAMRGRGWLSSFSLGNPTPDRGLPLVTAFSWDTGVQVTTGVGRVELTGSITNGSASNPRVSDDNAGKQLAARISIAPSAGLVVGSSFSRGAFLSRSALAATGAADDGASVQRAYGIDVEYSRGYWLLRGDAVLSEWTLPLANEPLTAGRLRAVALAAEGRYTVMPGAYVAARGEHLAFNRVAAAGGIVSWEAPVTRIELGGGYYLRRNLVARLSWQHNRRPAGRVTRVGLLAMQLLYWF